MKVKDNSLLGAISNRFESTAASFLAAKGVILVSLEKAYSLNENYKIDNIQLPIVRDVTPCSSVEWRDSSSFSINGQLRNWKSLEFYLSGDNLWLQIDVCALGFANKIFSEFSAKENNYKFLVYAEDSTPRNVFRGKIFCFSSTKGHFSEKIIFDILYDIKET